MHSHRIHVSTLADFLLTTADRWPERPVLIFPDARRSYAEFVSSAYTHARSLHGLGVRNGDYVGILMANCLTYLEVVMACSLLGAVAVPVNARYKPLELAYVIGDADLKVIVTSDHISEYANFPQRCSEQFREVGVFRYVV
ncbi:MAG: AMP-binding protein [Pseudomonadota bacterium]